MLHPLSCILLGIGLDRKGETVSFVRLADMKAHEIFRSISIELGSEVIGFLRTEDKDAYKSMLQGLANQRKLRPVFVTKKPLPKQLEWVQETLKLRQTEGVGEHLLQRWLIKSNSEMLISFLDAIGWEHDGEGGLDDVPEELDAAKASAGLDALLEKYPHDKVAIYMHVFQLQRKGGWSEIDQLLEERKELKLG